MNTEKETVQLLLHYMVEMRILLEECRNQQINITLAKKIDKILAELSDLD